MSCHGQERAGVIDHLLTLLLAEVRGANLREVLLCFRVNGGKFGLNADVTLFHPGAAMRVGSVAHRTLRGQKHPPPVCLQLKGKPRPRSGTLLLKMHLFFGDCSLTLNAAVHVYIQD